MFLAARARIALAGLVAAGSLVVGAGQAQADSPMGPVAATSWLHVDHPVGAIATIRDGDGRQALLRGVNMVGVQDGFYAPRTYDATWTQPMWTIDPAAYDGTCPANRKEVPDSPLCGVDGARPGAEQSGAFDSHDDLAQARALGYDHVRLTISWSQLEPTPGTYNTRYLDRIAQIVGWAKANGVYVLLDMHQDNYSRFLVDDSPVEVPGVVTSVKGSPAHSDGAPAWAIVTNGEPSLAPFGTDAFNAAMNAAFTSFWLNRSPAVPQGDAPGSGLQDHYIGAMAAVAKRFVNEPAVSGYEIMNEPASGSLPFPGGFEQGALYPFYRRVVAALTGTVDVPACPTGLPAVATCGYPDLGIHDTRHLLFFEPWALRNLLDASPQSAGPFTAYPNIVYAPHTYTHEFTVDRSVLGSSPYPAPYPVSYDQAFDTAAVEAQGLGAALFIGEFGNGSNDDDTLLREATAAQDRHLAGSALWQWKGNCNPGQSAGDCLGAWSVFAGDATDPPAQNGPVKDTRRRFTARPRPTRTVGDLLTTAYDPDTGDYAMAATFTGTPTPTVLTEVFLPARVDGPVAVTGAAVLDHVAMTVDGDRVAYLRPTGLGRYSLGVAPAGIVPVVPEAPAVLLLLVSGALPLASVLRRRRRA